jgi:hypothetical protein
MAPRILSAAQESLLKGDFQNKPVTQFVQDVCRAMPMISELRFRSYLPGSGLSQRLSEGDVIPVEVLNRAKAEAAAIGASLWDVVARSMVANGAPLSRTLLVEALTHEHDERERTSVLSRPEILDGGIDSICSTLSATEGLALCSQLRVHEGYALHLPMLDFAVRPSPTALAVVEEMLKIINQAGAIVNSGNSYHFIGVSLLTADEWVRFIGQSLLLAPFIDARFLGHRLYDGECRLRMFAPNKSPKVPVVVACVH